MEPGYENLIEYISEQLAPENLAGIIQISLKTAISKLIDDYIKSQFTEVIRDLIKKEIDAIRYQFQGFVNEAKKIMDLNIEFISRNSGGQAVKKDDLLDNLKSKKINQAFECFFNLQDVGQQEYYASCFNFEDFNEGNIEQKNAVTMALWAVSRRHKELLIKMIAIIRKGDGLSCVLREIVKANDPGLSDLRAIVIKKNI